MKNISAILLSICLLACAAESSAATAAAAISPAATGCTGPTIFVGAFDFGGTYGELRGYPLNSSGDVRPCADILGTSSVSIGDHMAIGIHGYIQDEPFTSSNFNPIWVYPRDSNDIAKPSRTITLPSGADCGLCGIAIDSNANDYSSAQISGQPASNCWYVIPASAKVANSPQSCDSNFTGAIGSLAVTPQDQLVVTGMAGNAARVDVVNNPSTLKPTVARSISGSATGLNSGFDQVAVDSKTGTLYVYDGTVPSILVFSSTANGNVAPLRTLSGSNVGLPDSTVLINQIISVDNSGNLYVAQLSNSGHFQIGVFGPNAHGNARPFRTFTDSSYQNSANPNLAIRPY